MSQFSAEERILLLVDFWTGQTGTAAKEIQSNFPNLIIKVIPPGTTSELQPEDIYFFRQRKVLWRKTAVHVRLFYPDIDITDRESCVLIQPHIRDQLLSPEFRDMIQYAFSKPGYVISPSIHFQNVNDACFKPVESPSNCFHSNSQVKCPHAKFICCSHYGAHRCFPHFFNVHSHVVKIMSSF